MLRLARVGGHCSLWMGHCVRSVSVSQAVPLWVFLLSDLVSAAVINGFLHWLFLEHFAFFFNPEGILHYNPAKREGFKVWDSLWR